MNPNEAKETARKFLEQYLNAKGINTSTNFSCLNPLHEDKHPSMSFDRQHNVCHCFSCGVNYDIFELVKIETGLEGKNLFNHVYQMFNLDVEYFSNEKKALQEYISHSETNPDKNINSKNLSNRLLLNRLTEQKKEMAEFINYCHKAVEKTDYWKKRGISKTTVDAYNLGYWEDKKRFIIPTGPLSYNARATWDAEKKDRYLKPKGQFELFNLSAISVAEQPVFVVEGEFDALSVIEAGGVAVALGSSSNLRFIDFVKSNRPKYPLLLALDNDDAGIKASQKLEEELLKLGIDFAQVNITEEFKDANEALVNDREGFIRNVEKAKSEVLDALEEEKKKQTEDYYKTAASNGLKDFIQDIEKRRNKDCISTGFNNLNEILDGGFYPGLYIIGAISSLGKTTFALQIADNVARLGQDVLVFSLEMGKQELISKSISRLSYQRCVKWNTGYDFATTTRSLMNGNSLSTQERIDFLNECLKDYSDYAGRIFYHIGIGDIGVEKIKSVIEKHIQITGRKPFIIIDYLQIIAPYDIRATDKQNTDKAVVELKRASRDCDVPIFAISSFNRENYTSPVNIASFKESGAIEYTSDVLMALQYKGMDYLKKEDGKYEDEKSRTARIIQLREEQEKNAEIPGVPQNIQLKILKNRNGKKGSIEFEFYPMFNCFSEPKKDWVLKSKK